jgi:hypothetical protein
MAENVKPESRRGSLLWLALIAIIWLTLPKSLTDPLWYAAVYNVGSSKVHYTPRPQDCDFTHGQLGDKRCHYKKIVQGLNAKGDLVAGDGAPDYGRSKSRRTIVSYDNKKTWGFARERFDTKVARVEISWVRVPD